LAAELPLVWGSTAYSAPGFSEENSFRAMGNPRLSLQHALMEEDSEAVVLDMALRLPLARSTGDGWDHLRVGFVADPTHLDRWAEDLGSLSAGLVHRFPASDNLEVRLRGGPALWFITGEESDTEFFAEYGVGLRTRGSGLQGGIDLRGIAALTSEDGGFSDRTLHRLQVEAGAPWGRSRLAGFARVNLDSDFANLARYTLGVRLDMGRFSVR
jgi:hypothetical protein